MKKVIPGYSWGLEESGEKIELPVGQGLEQ